VQRETSPPALLYRRGEQGGGLPLFFVCLFVCVKGGSACPSHFYPNDEAIFPVAERSRSLFSEAALQMSFSAALNDRGSGG